MSRSFSFVVVAALVSLCACPPADAQWLKLTTPNVPRTWDGKPNMKAPTPHIAGKPDLSGLWRYESDPYTNKSRSI
jgi:hypothetical protein